MCHVRLRSNHNILIMKILVCIKQVPDIQGNIQINNTKDRVLTDDWTPFRMNRYDEFAVEASLRIKERVKDAVIDVISVGGNNVSGIIRRAMGMGADNGIHLFFESSKTITPFQIASWIADYARDKGYDLILAGIMSEDSQQGVTGPMIAAILAIPCVVAVVTENVLIKQKAVYVERETERGFREAFEIDFPCLLSIQSGSDLPRYPSLSLMLRANSRSIKTIEVHASNASEPEHEVRLSFPEPVRAGDVLSGTLNEKAEKLVTWLKYNSII